MSDDIVRNFIKENIVAINSICKKYNKRCDDLALKAFYEEAFLVLKDAYNSFIKNNNKPEYLNKYLFSSLNNFVKSNNKTDKYIVYICPACNTILKEISDNKLICEKCSLSTNKIKCKVFAEHSKKGFACSKCLNFIPESYTGNCPFCGENDRSIKAAKHPTTKIKTKTSSLNDIDLIDNNIIEDKLYDRDYIFILNKIIDSQINTIHYKSKTSTIINKQCMYEAFKEIINKYPEDSISYFIYLDRDIKIHHKIFQSFINILESKFPFKIKKNNKFYEINSLLDNNLYIFDGVSEFDCIINDKFEIYNDTKELYQNSKKYFIGKLLDIVNLETNESVMSNVIDYNFNRITMNTYAHTRVRVKHLRIPPHYKMGGMVYLSRIRKSIIDQIKLEL